MGNKLKEVTYLTVKDLKKHDIILPGTYSNTFEGIAKKLEVNFDKENIILKDLQQDVNHVDTIVKRANENLTTLHKSTCDAQKAIKDKDDESLKAINSELSKMQKQIDFLQKELFSDPLTGAYNRKWFADYYLQDEKFQNNGFIAFIDLNKFKIINDQYGHIVGDQVLKYLVKFLQNELIYPGVDVVRYAGDEFIVLFDKEKTASLNVNKIMREAQKKLSEQKLKSAKIKELKFSFSYGLTSFKTNQDVEHILDIVDDLMYKNKEENR
ncbi:GGDEF domain-containing protein [Arcobacter sp. LA11]|uniref:GGDEF domain-containing protein n=1 Tax=Arcobacter sp. LA11 TaxID=1898176 RepID=UPI000933DDCA|nr:GGDEF domain-containing protein [Arcobacter sp. LA11]